MARQLSENEFDEVVKAMIADAAIEDGTVDKIAVSPALWWGVQRNIAAEREAKSQPWPPSIWISGWLKVAIPGFAVIAAVVGVLLYSATLDPDTDAIAAGVILQDQDTAPNAHVIGTKEPEIDEVIPKSVPGKQLLNKRVARGSQKIAKARVRVKEQPREPVKSEFIALTYGDRPDSGHLVRVKVPSSMMVTLGLVATVAKPTSLVDAEVVVGNDGMTHSIRFIR